MSMLNDGAIIKELGDLIQRDTYREDLLSATARYSSHPNLDVKKELVKAWLPFLEETLILTSHPALYVNDHKMFFEFLTTQKLVAYVANDLQLEYFLVSYAMATAAYNEQIPGPAKELMPHMMKQWHGVQLEDDTLCNPANMTAYLYGPAVWALYHDEAENGDPMLLSRYLIMNNIPFKNNTAGKPSSVAEPLSVPTNLL